jgi:L-seryl-tRNA(Ser) seleniumtransferase
LVSLERFGLPQETTARESIAAGADVVLFSADKLIGAAQAGIIVGRKELITRIRQHPLMRALRVDKTCLMVLERTLALFRDPDSLSRQHPTYRMLSWKPETLEVRAQQLRQALAEAAPQAEVGVRESQAFLGSGSLPVHALPSFVVTVAIPGLTADQLARRLRLDPACVFGRIEADRFCLDVRTLTDVQLPAITAAMRRLQP